MKNQDCLEFGNRILVSVIIPIFNRAHTISATLNSLRDQTYRPIEILVIDDGSSDQSVDIVRVWAERHANNELILKLHCINHLGAAAARNIGMAKATGKYLQFLDSDDLIGKQKLECQVNALVGKKATVAFSDFEISRKEKKEREVRRNDGPLLWRLSSGWSVSSSTPLIARNLVAGKISWLETLKSRQDMDFMFKTFLLSKEFVYTPGVMFTYVHHGAPQISDSYGKRPPQQLEEIKSLISFFLRYSRQLSLAKWGFLFLRIGEIALRAGKWKIKRLVLYLAPRPR